MVINSITADNKFDEQYNPIIENKDNKIPNTKAWFLFNLPVGIGLKQVLVISLSKSASYHMLSAPAAPAPIATKNIEKIEL